MIETWWSGRTALFRAPPRGRGLMPRSWRRWACVRRSQHTVRSGRTVNLVLVLHCFNTYKEGCSASEARQAVGGSRSAVVRGTNLAEAIHRLALWVGGLSTVDAICTLQQALSVPHGTFMRACNSRRDSNTGEVRINHEAKPMPIASLPDNWSAFNDHEVLPWHMCRADAAATLRRARSLRGRGQATISVESAGRYSLSTFNTLILQTRRC